MGSSGDVHEQLSKLVKRKQYEEAIRMAEANAWANVDVYAIIKEYGDHLYRKGAYEKAVEQYSRTMQDNKTFVQPSYVIRKLLDAQQIDHLSAYLEALHRHSCATKDHTTLLLNCFAKAQDTTRLEQFLNVSVSNTKANASNFDVETAIRVCRQMSYFDHALRLARDAGKHAWFLRIAMEDAKDYVSAVRHIASLDVQDKAMFARQYGRELIKHEPEATTEILQEICLCDKPVLESRADDVFFTLPPKELEAKDFFHIFGSNRAALLSFVEHIVEHKESSSAMILTLLELYLKSTQEEVNAAANYAKAMQLLEDKYGDYDGDAAIALTHQFHFDQGTVFLYQRMQYASELFRHHEQRGDADGVLGVCDEFDEQEPQLWVQALAFFVQEQPENDGEIQYILERTFVRHVEFILV